MEHSPQDLIWLDTAFAKDRIDTLRAACYLAGFSDEHLEIVRDNAKVPAVFHFSDNKNSEATTIFQIIDTLYAYPGSGRFYKMPFLWFIEQAIIRNVPYVKFDLLLPRCAENAYRKNECIKNYPELAEKLGLLSKEKLPKKNKKSSEPPKTKEKLPKPVGNFSEELILESRKLADKFGLEDWNTGIRQISARSVCDRVSGSLEKDVKNHGIRGAFDGGSVRRYGLKDWKFVPPKIKSK